MALCVRIEQVRTELTQYSGCVKFHHFLFQFLIIDRRSHVFQFLIHCVGHFQVHQIRGNDLNLVDPVLQARQQGTLLETDLLFDVHLVELGVIIHIYRTNLLDQSADFSRLVKVLRDPRRSGSILLLLLRLFVEILVNCGESGFGIIRIRLIICFHKRFLRDAISLIYIIDPGL